ncbi:hypothetical protein NEDG_02026 [Nematocida displodere]|uniref:ARID domain-containing protein n=1 Tax=Nematocida displodere TaxID=1805483 RepID=A0A177EEU6_9MICR|nr:hypothetical protein NEDG_02026 [Nematocida displodere]
MQEEDRACAKTCTGCRSCKKQEPSKKMSISDAFLKETIYTKKPTYYNILAESRTPAAVQETFKIQKPPTSPGPPFSQTAYPFWESVRTRPRAPRASQRPYNPVSAAAYETGQHAQLKQIEVHSSLFLSLIDFSAPLIAQHVRLNGLLGMPRVHPHHETLARDAVTVVISYGGIQMVDEKHLWARVAKEAGHPQEDFGRFRMYYIIVCYPYEQVAIARRTLDTNYFVLVVYVDAKKGDIFPDLLKSVAQKKKKRGQAASIRVTETSGPLEIVCALNHTYQHGVQSASDLLAILQQVSQYTCQAAPVSKVFSCGELALLHAQMRQVVCLWLSHLLATLKSKDIRQEKEVIIYYHSYLMQQVPGPTPQSLANPANPEHPSPRCSEDPKDPETPVNAKPENPSPRCSERPEKPEKPERHIYICSRCGTKQMTETPENFYSDAFDALSKTTALVATTEPASLLVSLVSSLPKESLGFNGEYVRKVLICAYNLLKGEHSPATAQNIRTQLQTISHLLSPEVSSLLLAPVLSVTSIHELLEGGELEVVIKVLMAPGGSAFLSGVSPKRLAEIWRYLLSLFSTGFFVRASSRVRDTALFSIDLIAKYLQLHLSPSTEHVLTPEHKRALCSILDIESAPWLIDALRLDVFPSSAYLLCDEIHRLSGSGQDHHP